MYLSNEESYNIVGGAINGTFINALARVGKFFYDMGYQVGSALRRAFSKNYC